MLRKSLLAAALLVAGVAASAADAPFDLAGPALHVTVTRGSTTLPIAAVPNLAAGDRIAIGADLPDTQSQHYLLVAAFLREATNPPPKTWFYRAETWTPKGRAGLKLTVPAGARQVMVFLAPETGGGFGTVIKAVRARPGAFIRAAQELDQAALDRSRLDAFLAAVRTRASTNPAGLETVSPLLARSLAIKIEPSCLDKAPALQAACLTQDRNAIVLSDGHSNSVTDALTGTPTDLALQLSATPKAGLGYYSPYIGVVRDVVRILGSFGTAQYQYLPALATMHGDSLALLLNATPSFTNPRSVLVTALPAVDAAKPPPLRPATKDVFCAQAPGLVLPVDGAPLVYSTGYAHDLAVRVRTKDGRNVDLPAAADPEKGGVAVDMSGFTAANFDTAVDGVLHGTWGFDPFDGPHFGLQNAAGASWRIAAGDEQSLVAGRDVAVRLEGAAASCVSGVQLRQPSGATDSVKWSVEQPGVLAATLPLGSAEPGALTLLIGQHGNAEPVALALKVFTEVSRIDGMSYNVGDTTATLSGHRLDQVAGLRFADIDFKPAGLTRLGGSDQLTLAMTDPASAAALGAGVTKTARIKLGDGRTTSLKVTVGGPRPTVALADKTIAKEPPGPGLAIRLKNPDALPVDARLTFAVRAGGTTRFAGQETIEVAAGGGPSVQLTAANGLTVRDDRIAVATLDPAKVFTRSAFGPLHFRIVQDGVPGDWLPLATLVRLPSLQGVSCDKAHACVLSGTDLFLLDGVSNSADLADPAAVPDGITSSKVRVPRPKDGHLYLKLHDDPGSAAEIIARGG